MNPSSGLVRLGCLSQGSLQVRLWTYCQWPVESTTLSCNIYNVITSLLWTFSRSNPCPRVTGDLIKPWSQPKSMLRYAVRNSCNNALCQWWRYSGGAVPVCSCTGCRLAGPSVSWWCACRARTPGCYRTGCCRRRPICDVIWRASKGSTIPGWTRWWEGKCPRRDRRPRGTSCAVDVVVIATKGCEDDIEGWFGNHICLNLITL